MRFGTSPLIAWMEIVSFGTSLPRVAAVSTKMVAQWVGVQNFSVIL
jgi:hypothetical protein